MSIEIQVPDEAILVEVLSERYRQFEKWGVQSHVDIWESTADGIGEALECFRVMAARYKALNDDPNPTDWTGILLEEVYEALEQIGHDANLREELVQVAAVAVAWIEAIDRRG